MRQTSVLLLLLAVVACSSSGGSSNPDQPLDSLGRPIESDDFIDIGPAIERASELPIGAFLGEVATRVQAWNRAQLEGDETRERLLLEVLEFESTKRQAELIDQLESGPSRNRAIAAVALGFTNTMMVLESDFSTTPIDRGHVALGPLLSAIDDPDPKVAANALMGLGILERPETPIGPICARLDGSPDPIVRSNAAYALTAILQRAARQEDGIEPASMDIARATCQRGLADDDLGVRTQAAAALGLVGDASSIAHLGDRLDDEVALVSQAAGTAMVLIARGDPTLKGKVARVLAGRLDMVRPSRRDLVVFYLALLAGVNKGSDTEVWMDWALSLPA